MKLAAAAALTLCIADCAGGARGVPPCTCRAAVRRGGARVPLRWLSAVQRPEQGLSAAIMMSRECQPAACVMIWLGVVGMQARLARLTRRRLGAFQQFSKFPCCPVPRLTAISSVSVASINHR